MKLKIILGYGAIGGLLIVSTWFIGQPGASEATDFSNGEVLGYAIMLLALSVIFLGIKRIKDQSGHLTFLSGFLTGLGITMVASVIYVIGWLIYVPTYAPGFADKYGASQKELVLEKEISETEKKRQVEEIDSWVASYKKPHVMAAITFIEIFPLGLLVTLISALILKSKKNST